MITVEQKNVTALALYSGGLDSILACRVMAAQGVKVVAIRFVTPFFGYELLKKQEAYIDQVRRTYGIEVCLRDVSRQFLELLRDPPHGFGKRFNPCLDCKILLASEVRKLLPEYKASFIITGEVVGQRPMSQRKDAMRVVERDSGCDGILVRPLCAKNMLPTKPEQDGLIDRQRLHNFSGRGRSRQIELAHSFGITDYPSPAGGCVLTDVTLGPRVGRYYQEHATVRVADIRLLLVGRQYRLPGGGWFALGRDSKENELVLANREPGDLVLWMTDRNGPVGILRRPQGDDLTLAAGLVVRYGRKVSPEIPATVAAESDQGTVSIKALPLADAVFQPWVW